MAKRLNLRAQETWDRWPERMCYSMHACALCNKDISLGEYYVDGGYSRRAHSVCICKLPEVEKTDASL